MLCVCFGMNTINNLTARHADFVDLSWMKAGKETPATLLPLDHSRHADADNSIRIDCKKQLVRQLAGSNGTQDADSAALQTYLAASKARHCAYSKVSNAKSMGVCVIGSTWSEFAPGQHI